MIRFKLYILILLIITPIFLFAQPDKKHAITLTTGLVDYFYQERKNNFSAGLIYTYRPFKTFAFDGFYLYSQSNSFPSYFDDKQRLHNYLMSQNGFRFIIGWSEVYTHSIGLRVHYSIISNNKWHLSLNFAFGGFYSKSSYQGFKYWSWHPTTGQIIDYEFADRDQGSVFDSFVSPGLNLHYNFYDDFIIGINPGLFYSGIKTGTEAIIDGLPVIIPIKTAPVLPDFINLSIIVGKKF